MISARVSLCAAIAAALSACAEPADRGVVKAPSAPLGSVQVEPGAPSVPWREKTHDQRMEYMGLVVYPKMKEVFRAYRAGSTADPSGPPSGEPSRSSSNAAPFRCQTCHGEDMATVNFRMPNTLRPLPPENAVDAAAGRDPDTTRFMVDVVVPAMRTLLGTDVPCSACHPAGRP